MSHDSCDISKLLRIKLFIRLFLFVRAVSFCFVETIENKFQRKHASNSIDAALRPHASLSAKK